MSIRSGLRRAAAAMLAALMLLAAFSGCSGDKAPVETIRLSGIMGDDARHQVYADVLTEFTVAHPEIYLRDVTTTPGDAFKLEANLAATYAKSDSPHIIYYYSGSDMDAISDCFVSVEEIRKEYPDFLAGIGANVLDAVRAKDGQSYCIPVMGDWRAIAINDRIFAKYGLSIPTTWSGLLEVIDRLSAEGMIPFANSAEDSKLFIEPLVRYVGGQAAVRYGIRGEDEVLRSIWSKALDYYYQLCRRKAFAPSALTPALEGYVAAPTLYDATLGDRDKSRPLDPVELFGSGKAAMLAVDREVWGQLEDTANISLMYLPDCTETAETTQTAVSAVSASDTSSSDVSFSDVTAAMEPPKKIYGGFSEGFYITRKAYNDPNLRSLVLELIESFADVQTADRFAAMGYLPANSGSTQYIRQLSVIAGAAADGAPFTPSVITASDTARWSYIDQCSVQLWFGMLSTEQMIDLLCEDSMNAVDVLAALEEAVSSGDLHPAE